jgi:hypothetical protein
VELTRASLVEIVAYIAELRTRATVIELDVVDPDFGRGRYAGETLEYGDVAYIHRPFRVWVDLA